MNWLIISLVILVLILIGLATFYFFFLKNKSNPEPITSPSPEISISPKSSPAISPSDTNKTTTNVKIFLIAQNDNGKSGNLIGCGDSVVGVTKEIPATQTVLQAAFEELLKIKDKNYGESGLYNALAPSSLTFASATITDGIATVKLNGELVLSGTCEDPRIVAQLEETAKQFPTVDKVIILINGKDLKDLTDLRG